MTLEILLNKLIEKGWNVFWHKDRINAEKCKYSEWIFYEFENHNMSISLRELVSKESGLRQFCCDNELIKGNTKEAYYWQYKTPLWAEWSKTYRKAHYQHRLIESALCNEEALEQFLLDNIKIDE